MQLLIYETAVPVNSVQHAKASVDAGGNFRFAKNVNSVPLMAVEFPFAASDYAIVFAGNRDNPMPAVILGMRDKQNLFLDDAGAWQAKYLPAFVRRYPFVFSNSNDGKTFTLCIDEAFSGFNTEGRGQRLFTDEGKPSEFTNNVLKFVEEYQRQFERTRAFCRKLVELDLLESMQAQMALATGETTSLTGFMAVNRNRLKALSVEKLAELANTDELELIYLHLFSMRNFNAMKDRLQAAK
jgi:SapC